MNSRVLVFAVILAFSTTAMALDIAISTQANWWSQAAADREMQEIVDNVPGASIELFPANEQDALADWVRERTGDGASDLLILCGQFPDTLYAPGNSQADDSLAELFLDDGNCIINTGDYMFYVVNTAGTNGEGGIRTMMDIPGITMWDDDTAVVVTPDGQDYTPTLQDFATDRPFHLDELEGAWEPELILAQNDTGTRADPAIVVNTETGGRLGIFYQTAGQDNDPRGEVISEWINNWYIPNVASSRPYAWSPSPRDGTMIEQTTAFLTWKPGDFADVHNVYFGDDADAVAAATPDDADLFAGTVPNEMIVVGLGADALTPGKTYYWRVDAVNDADAASPWKGNVWSFNIKPLIAYQPSPADGAINVLLDQELTWEAGIGTIFHYVAHGTSFDEVNNIPVPTWMTVDPVYDPGALEPDTTYYWRVDEFKGATADRGEVWSFTTVPEVAVTDPDLVGWWTLDEGVGTTAVDWSGHGHHGALIGDPQWTDGYHGGALEFDGRGDHVDLGNPPDWPAGQSARSMCGWAKTDSLLAGWRWIAAYGSQATSQAMFIGLNGTDLYGGGYGDDVNLDGFWQAGVWHHICLTYDGTTARLYADGQEVASAAKTWNLAPSRAHIGRQVNDLAEFWDGTLDDVRIYSKALTPAEITDIMRGNTLLAADPEPAQSATVDIRDATALRWSAGETAASHDVYFGTDRAAVAAADRTAPEYRGNQVGTSMSLAGLVEFGGGDYYWRIDEVEAGGATIHEGYIWKFTVPGYLIVDDFESYTNDSPNRVFQTWIDGWGFSADEFFPSGHPGNGSNAAVGHDIWTDTSPYFNGLLMETQTVHGGFQSMPVDYGNDLSPFYSEIDRTWVAPQNWALNGVDTLTLHVSGAPGNGVDRFYVTLTDSSGRSATVEAADTSVLTSRKWSVVSMPLADFTGVNAAAIKKMTVGLGNPPAVGGAGSLLFDDFRVTAAE